MSTTFAALGVPEAIVAALDARGITSPFPIQAAALQPALAGRDVCGRAPTGSGKTIAFGIPLVSDLPPANKRRPTGLVLAPTRELAQQIADELVQLGRPFRVSVLAVYGGVSYGPQRSKLNRGVDIVVACPGRLEDLLSDGSLSLDDVQRVVIDEADRMADMGFMPCVQRILDACASDRQTMLFSATLDGAVDQVRSAHMHDEFVCEIDDGVSEPDHAHVVRDVKADARVVETADLVKRFGPTIVFVRTKHGADRLAKRIGDKGVRAAAIHGDRTQAQRARALDSFASGKVQALIATDVAARGIHVDDVACVVHYDPPVDAATYVHRSGRTGRAGSRGVVVSLSTDTKQWKSIQRMLRSLQLDVVDLPEPIERPKPSRPAPTMTRPAPRRTTADRPPTRSSGRPNRARSLTGAVKFFNGRRGYGFILHDDRELFFHKSHVRGPIKQGQQVQFELGTGPNGTEAQKVTAA